MALFLISAGMHATLGLLYDCLNKLGITLSKGDMHVYSRNISQLFLKGLSVTLWGSWIPIRD